MTRRPALLVIVLLSAVGWVYWGRLAGLDDRALAQRLLSSRGIWCAPEIVDRIDEGELRVVCADATHLFAAVPSCSESFACATLGFDAACWERAVAPDPR